MKDMEISSIEPVKQNVWPNLMNVNNTSPNIYGQREAQRQTLQGPLAGKW